MASRQNRQTQRNTNEVEETVVEAVEAVEANDVVETVVEAPVETSKPVEVKPQQKPASSVSSFLRGELDQYTAAMAGNRYISGSEGAAWQLKLLNLLDRVFNRVPNQDFRPCMEELLSWFHANRDGVASDRLLFRFSAEWTAGREKHDAFTRLAAMCTLIADPVARPRVVSDLNIPYYTAFGLTEAGRERLLSFLNK